MVKTPQTKSGSPFTRIPQNPDISPEKGVWTTADVIPCVVGYLDP